jgi:hypothetical protein
VVEGVLVQVGLGLGIGRYHDAVHRRDLGRGFCSSFGWSAFVDAGLANVAGHIAKLILSGDLRRNWWS